MTPMKQSRSEERGIDSSVSHFDQPYNQGTNARYCPPQTRPDQENLLWRDKKRPFFGLPVSFTTYSLYEDRLIIQTGLLTRNTEEIRLYRVTDVSLKQSLFQRLFKLGSIKVTSADATTPRQFIHDVLHPEAVYRLVSDASEEQRKLNRIVAAKFFD